MKAICIDDKWEDFPNRLFPSTSPLFGEIVTITNAFSDEYGNWYELVEHDGLYEQCAFALISEIDETNFQRQYNKLKEEV